MRIMFVRLVFGKVQTNKMEEIRGWYQTEDVPAMKNQKGLRMLLFLESVDSPDEAVSLSIWDSKEDAEAWEKSGPYKELVKKAMLLLAEESKSKSYAVTVVHQA